MRLAFRRGAAAGALLLLTLSGLAAGQSYDEGVAPTRPVQDAEGAQFEASSDARPQSRPQSSGTPLTGNQVQDFNARGQALEGELRDLNARMVETDRLLSQIAGGGFLATNGMVVTFIPREGLIAWAQIELYRQGTGIGGATTDEEVLRRVRQIVAQTPGMTATLRRVRQQDWARREEIVRELDQIRRTVMADADRPGTAYEPTPTSGRTACGLPHSWSNAVQGGGASTWTVDASGAARESGLQNATGEASLQGDRLTIRFTVSWVGQSATHRMTGRYLITLDDSCNGAGSLVLDTAPRGGEALVGQTLSATFTSLGGG